MRALACFTFVFGLATSALAQDGSALYAQHCAQCHDANQPRTPPRSTLEQLAPDQIVAALEAGVMRVQGADRTPAERRALAVFLSKASGTATAQPSLKMCTAPAGASGGAAPWSGWGHSLANDRLQRSANLKADDVPKLKLRWAFAFPGDVSAAVQPSVDGDRVLVGSAKGRVYALSLRDGCAYWIFDAGATVRTSIEVADAGGSRLAFFGDIGANVYAVDVATGALRWKSKVEAHRAARVTGTPRFYRGRVYVPVSSIEEVTGASPRYECCTFRGSVVALDAATGTQAWKTYVITEEPIARRKNKDGTQLYGPSGAAIWSSPTIDEKLQVLYVATGDGYSDPPAETTDAIMALDLQTGAIKWAQQMTKGDSYNLACGGANPTNCPDAKGPDVDFGSPPILVNLTGGRRALVVGQKSAVVHAVDPDNGGKILWATRIGKGGVLGGVEWGSAADADHIYAPLSDIAFKNAGVSIGAMSPDGAAGGGLFALRLADGKEAWHAPIPGCADRPKCSPAQSAPPSVIDGVVFSGSLDGHLRGYSTRDGRIVWDVDTAQEVTTVNGSKAHGGSIDVGGPAIANGVVLTTSGYAQWGGMNGNVLLAFSVDGK